MLSFSNFIFWGLWLSQVCRLDKNQFWIDPWHIMVFALISKGHSPIAWSWWAHPSFDPITCLETDLISHLACNKPWLCVGCFCDKVDCSRYDFVIVLAWWWVFSLGLIRVIDCVYLLAPETMSSLDRKAHRCSICCFTGLNICEIIPLCRSSYISVSGMFSGSEGTYFGCV